MLSRKYQTESEIRTKQINTLKVFNDNVTEIKEGSEYQVSFTSGEHDMCVQVSLTANFPNEKPHLKIVPAIVHPWVDAEGGVISAPGLLNAIIREFERTPPPLASEQQPGSNITSPTVPIIGTASPNYPYMVNQNFSPPSTSTASSTVQSLAFPELNSLSLEDLRFIYENEDRQEEFIDSLPQVKETNRILDEFVAQIEKLADTNLSRQDRLLGLRSGIDARIEEVSKLAFENERLSATYQTLSEKYSPKNIKEQLRIAAESADSDSEKVAESFLGGEIDVDKFVTLYLQTRNLSHSRKAKEEKLTQQLHNLARAGF